MPRFLTPAWFDELNDVARASAAVSEATRGVELTIQQIVTDAPGGEVRYVVRVRDGVVEVKPGATGSPDVTVTQDHATACAVIRGELRAPGALIAGRIHVAGNLQTVLAHQDTLRSLDGVFESVRAGTEL